VPVVGAFAGVSWPVVDAFAGEFGHGDIKAPPVASCKPGLVTNLTRRIISAAARGNHLCRVRRSLKSTSAQCPASTG
jgi:hypothetical protein